MSKRDLFTRLSESESKIARDFSPASKFTKIDHSSSFRGAVTVTKKLLPSAPALLKEEMNLVFDEASLGMTQFLRNGVKIPGVIKSRFSDFLVREVDSKGNVVRLTDFAAPPEEAELSQEEIAKEAAEKEEKFPEGVKELRKVASSEAVDGFESWSKLTEKEKLKNSYILKGDFDKPTRTRVHEIVKLFLPSYYSSFANGGVEIKYRKHGSDMRMAIYFLLFNFVEAREKNFHTIQFTLWKTNRDTMQVINEIAGVLRNKSSNFTFAGTKDRRAVTTQLCTVTGKIKSSRLLRCNHDFMKTGNFKYVEQAIRLGELSGNEFEIVLRECDVAENDLNLASLSVLERGFINYFGLQRFGTSSISTHRIGRALLLGNYLVALYLILCPRLGEKDDIEKARQDLLRTGNIANALHVFPFYLTSERTLLEKLLHDTKDILGAIQAVLSYFYFTFNFVASY